MYEIYAKKDGKWSMVGRSYTLSMAKERASRIAHKGLHARLEDPKTDDHWDYGPVYSDKPKKARKTAPKKTRTKKRKTKKRRTELRLF